MATLYGRKRRESQKIQSGSRYAEVFGPPLPAIPIKIESKMVEAGWACAMKANGKGASTASSPRMVGMFGPIYQRFFDSEGNLCQPLLLRGVAYTHGPGLINAGDIQGSLMCLGTNGESVDPGGVGTHKYSRVVIIGKRKYK